MSEEKQIDESPSRKVGLIAALITFATVILMGGVVYIALDQVEFERLRVSNDSSSAVDTVRPEPDAGSTQDK